MCCWVSRPLLSPHLWLHPLGCVTTALLRTSRDVTPFLPYSLTFAIHTLIILSAVAPQGSGRTNREHGSSLHLPAQPCLHVETELARRQSGGAVPLRQGLGASGLSSLSGRIYGNVSLTGA